MDGKTSMQMNRKAPPLNLLNAFETVARHLSIKQASNELNVTPSAVSQKIKLLEEFIGAPLFYRTTRKVTLTSLGKKYLIMVDDLLKQHEKNYSALFKEFGKARMRLDMPSFIGYDVIFPNLSELQKKFSDIDLTIETSDELIDFETEPVDAAIRYLEDEPEDLYARLISKTNGALVCSDKFPKLKSLKTLNDITKSTLIHSRRQNQIWINFGNHFNLNLNDNTNGIFLDNYLSTITAAEQGLGLALAVMPISKKRILAGSLITPLKLNYPLKYSVYFVQRKSTKNNKRLDELYEWLVSIFNRL